MIRIFQRSLIISKDQLINKCNGVTYNIRGFCKETVNNNDREKARKEFEKFKRRKQIENMFEQVGLEEPNLIKLKEGENESTIDVDFITKKLNFTNKDKYINLKDLITGDIKKTPGYENFDMTPEESAYGLMELEKMLKKKDGEKVVGQLINELKQAFGLESDSQMERKLEDLNKEMTLRLGEPIEPFITKYQKDISQLNQHQRVIVHEYFEKHPFLKNIRQTSFVLDLIALSEQYQNSNGENFEENMKKYFDIDPNTIQESKTNKNSKSGDALEKSEEDPFETQNLEDIEFIQPVDTPFLSSTSKEDQGTFEDKMIRIIKSGTLSMYLQQVVKDTTESLDPVTAKMERERAEKKILNEMDVQDRILKRELEKIDLESRSPYEDAELGDIDDKRANLELDMDDYFDADVTPEFDMISSEAVQQQAKDPRDYLKYYHLYPRQIRKWIDYSHTPLGLFTSFGVWYNLPNWYSQHFQPTPPESHLSTKKNQNVFKQPELPDDLKNAYRFGVTEEEARLLHPKFKEFLSFRNASQPEVNSYRKQLCIEKYGESLQDTGSSSVQIAILTERINYLNAHLAKNKKDFVAKKRIPEVEKKRRNLIAYLKKTNIEEYFRVTKDLRLKNFQF
ncbi:hypothetical protein RB653_008956 [Dictyostelium firmibasis]|uniref:Ribosomal protein S15 n=1 Tax=Dictyostelium firmibasis TaxID=79012 RepID=A0AAN7Z078_9MYCE